MPGQTHTSFHAMGSRIAISADDASPAADAALRQARGWFQAWESCLSRFQPESELSRLNRGEVFALSPDFLSVLRASLRAARQTGGLVTSTILSALEMAGYDRSFEQIRAAQPSLIQPLPSPDAWQSIRLEQSARTVSLPQGLRLDFGGIAKGWAADRAARRLGRRFPVLVDAGGDIAVSGPDRSGQPWRVAVVHPLEKGRRIALLPLLRGGLATSGRTERAWQRGEHKQHHLIDPRSGRPADTDILAVTVLASSALEAEVAAKAILILGTNIGLEWLNARPSLAAILALENGEVIFSPALSAYRAISG